MTRERCGDGLSKGYSNKGRQLPTWGGQGGEMGKGKRAGTEEKGSRKLRTDGRKTGEVHFHKKSFHGRSLLQQREGLVI